MTEDQRETPPPRRDDAVAPENEADLGEPNGGPLRLRDSRGAQAEPEVSSDQQMPRREGYAFEGQIARGGMGRILLARDTELGREVAIKVLDESLLDEPVALRRFVEEAQIAGQLQHPGVVPVYEMGHFEDQRPFFAMKLVKGRTFGEVLDARAEIGDGEPEELANHLAAFESVCQTVAYAHAKGVIHRDLKPANIMLGAFGEVLVLDWGLAKVLDGSEPEAPELEAGRTVIETVRSGSGSSPMDSVVGSVLGTPAYMPPEQARGDLANLDERSDVFSLGAILCQILTGRPPYQRTEDERTVVVAAMARLEPALERLERVAVDEELVALCRQCLTPAPAARPKDASEVARRVREYRAGIAERARRAQLAAAEARVKAEGERRARRWTLGLAGVTLSAGLLAAVVHFRRESARSERIAELRADIAATRAEVLRLGESGRSSEALELARGKLVAVAKSPDVTEDLRAEAHDVEALALSRVERERSAREAAERDQAFVARLEELRWRVFDTLFRSAPEDLNDDFQEAFERYGIPLDLDDGELDEQLALLRSSGLDTAIIPALDDWAGMLRRVHGPDVYGSQLLVSIAMDLDDNEAHDELRLAILNHDVDTMLALSDRIVELDLPANATWNLAWALYENQQTAALGRVIDLGVRRNPRDLFANLGAGIYLRSLGRQDRALPLLRSVCVLRPDAAHARLLLGSTLYELGDAVGAAYVLERAIFMEPSADAYTQLAYCLTNLGDYSGAVRALEQAYGEDPESSFQELELLAARFLAKEVSDTRVAEELRGVQSASELVPFGFAYTNHPDPLLRDYDTGERIAQLVIDQAPNAPEGWEIRARAMLGKDRFEDALEAARAMDERPNHHSHSLRASALYLQCRALVPLNRSDEAQRVFERAEQIATDLFSLRKQEWEASEVATDRRLAREAIGR